MLDAIVSPAQRSFEYHPHWHDGEQMGAFKDTEGDYFLAWFCAHGAVIRGFAHGSPVSTSHDSPSRLLAALWDGLPSPLAYAKTEPAFGGEDVTFACWALILQVRPSRILALREMSKYRREGIPMGPRSCYSAVSRATSTSGLRTTVIRVIPKEALADLCRPDFVLVGATLAAINRDFDLKAVREEAAALDWPIDISETLETSFPLLLRRAQRASRALGMRSLSYVASATEL